MGAGFQQTMRGTRELGLSDPSPAFRYGRGAEGGVGHRQWAVISVIMSMQ